MSFLEPKILARITPVTLATSLIPALVCLSSCCAPTTPSNVGVPTSTQATSDPNAIRTDGRSFYVQPRKGNKVVYLCQANGSMLERWGVFKNMAKALVLALNPEDQFNVILMYDDQTLVLFPGGCQPTTNEMMTRAINFIDNANPSGESKLFDGAKAASQMHPDHLYLVANGYFSARESAADALKDFQPVFANPSTVVNCVIIPPPQDGDARTILPLIATRGHGRFIDLTQN